MAELEEAELDRLAAALGRGRELPEDLVELMWAIATPSIVRMADPDAAAFMLGRFEALDVRVGEMSMVIEARDPRLDRKVAITLRMSADAQAEAALAKLYETGKWKERTYFVIEWVKGEAPEGEAPNSEQIEDEGGLR